MACGVFRFELGRREIPKISERMIQAEGVIIEEPRRTESGTSFVLRLQATSSIPRLKVYASVYDTSDLQYGDLVRAGGALRAVDRPDTPGYWKNYLETKGIFYELSRPHLEYVSEGEGNPILSMLFSLKGTVLARMNRQIPEPEVSLFSGIIVGARSMFGKELSDQFNKVGVAHIVALSGYNITMLARWVQKGLHFLPRTAGIVSSASMILLFVLMAGASASAVRAAIMALIMLLARKEGRTYDAGIALIVAAVLMVLYEPLTLMNDFGFQLSFLAASGIIWLVPILDGVFKNITPRFGIREAFLTTLSAEAMVLPLITYKSGVLSLVGLFANILIVPLLPLIMMLGFAYLPIMFLPVVSQLVAYVLYVPLTYVIRLVSFLYYLPYAHVSVTTLPLIVIGMWYAFLIYVILRFHEGDSAKTVTA